MRSATGQSIIELSAALIVFIPLMLLFVDAMTLVYASYSSNAIVRDAVRAAATQNGDSITGGAAAKKLAMAIVQRTPRPALIDKIELSSFEFNRRNSVVSGTVTANVIFPVQLGGWTSASLKAAAVLPITSAL